MKCQGNLKQLCNDGQTTKTWVTQKTLFRDTFAVLCVISGKAR